MQALRDLSSRAQITPSSFVNEYNWGDFRGTPLKLVEKYFDAFLYVANWGTHWLMFKVPRKLVDVDLAEEYCSGQSSVLHEKEDAVIFEFTSEIEDYDWEEGEGWLSSLISLRSDILQGDYRSLYLAWLYCAGMHEIDDEELEPPIPPNLTELTGPLKSFVDFMRIDPDLIAVAAANSISENRQTDPEAIKSWISNLPAKEKDNMLFRLVEAPSAHLGAELKHRFLKSISSKTNSDSAPELRRVSDLLEAAEKFAPERERRAAEQKARAKARKKREAELARKEYLESLADREDRIWKKVEAYINSRQPAKYDEAVKLLIDLRDLSKTFGNEKTFSNKFRTICSIHYRKVTFMDRLQKAGLKFD
jgi:hypothetical protein